MHPRCGLIFLICTVFFGLNVVFEEVLSVDGQERAYGAGGLPHGAELANRRVAQAAELFKGQYVLRSNNSVVFRGRARMAMGSRLAGARGLQLSSVVVTLLRGGDDRPAEDGLWSEDVDFVLRGVDFLTVKRMTAFGVSDPGANHAFGATPCRLDAVLDFQAAPGDNDLLTTGASAPAALAEGIGAATGVSPGVAPGVGAAPSLRGSPWPGQRGGGDVEGNGAAHVTGFSAEVVSADCGFSLSLTAKSIDVARIGRKVIRYAIWTNLLTAIQIRCFLAQMRHTEEGPSAAKLSLVGIAAQALLDGYDSFLHLCLSASSQYMFNTFAVISLFKFVLFALLEVRYLLTIWRVRYRFAFSEGWDAVRRELSKVYSYFYGALIGGLVIIFKFLDHLDIIIIILQVYWLPQIIYDVQQGSKNALHPHFLIGISVTRCLGLLYLWGCPSGVFDGDLYPPLPNAPSPRLCVAVVLLTGTQVAILVSQKLFGPRWFVPWLCMPHVYNYRRSAELPENTECVICMGEMSADDASQRVITPCDHRFHLACLERWLDVKMECPTCRAVLPPMA